MRFVLLIVLLLAAACSSAEEATDGETTAPAPVEGEGVSDSPEAQATSSAETEAPAAVGEVIGRTNVQPSGNRYLPGARDLTEEPTTIALGFPAVWLLPLADGSLIAVSEEGTATRIAQDETLTSLTAVDPMVRPLAIADGDNIVLVPANEGVDSDLPDATEVQSGDTRAWFDGATERVPHGALGDTIEATRLVIVRPVDSASGDSDSGGVERVVVDLEDDPTESVFEGLSPLLADITGDGEVDVLTTVSDGVSGARLVAFDTAGQRIAASEPVGQPNRWRHQIAVAPTNPNGGINEVIEVETPHIGGLLQFRRVGDGELALLFQTREFRSHVLGSRNLDGAVVFDADDDGTPEVVIPTQDLAAIALVDSEPADPGPAMVDLGGATVSSNLALGETDDGLIFAVGLSDGSLLVWRP